MNRKKYISLLTFVAVLSSYLMVGNCIAANSPWAMFLPAVIGSGSGNGGGNEITDCNGEVGGNAVFDECGVCGGDGSTCANDGFERSTSGKVVTDMKTNLMWQDISLSFKDEAGGITYCDEKSLDGYDDWRLPTLSEIQVFFRRVDVDADFDLNHWGTFSGCTANVAIGGYVRTPVGAQTYGGNTGDTINFSGGAAARCVR